VFVLQAEDAIVERERTILPASRNIRTIEIPSALSEGDLVLPDTRIKLPPDKRTGKKRLKTRRASEKRTNRMIGHSLGTGFGAEPIDHLNLFGQHELERIAININRSIPKTTLIERSKSRHRQVLLRSSILLNRIERARLKITDANVHGSGFEIIHRKPILALRDLTSIMREPISIRTEHINRIRLVRTKPRERDHMIAWTHIFIDRNGNPVQPQPAPIKIAIDAIRYIKNTRIQRGRSTDRNRTACWRRIHSTTVRIRARSQNRSSSKNRSQPNLTLRRSSERGRINTPKTSIRNERIQELRGKRHINDENTTVI
jgi:hypothetical protein